MTIATGSTLQSVTVQIVDDSGLGVTGLVAATFPATSYKKAGNTAAITITLADLALITTPWASGGVKEISGGYYRLDLPDAALNANTLLTLIGEASGKHLVAPVLQVDDLLPNVNQAVISGAISAGQAATNTTALPAMITGGSKFTAVALENAPSGGTGTGDVLVDHNYGGTDALRITEAGFGVDNVIIQAFIASEYTAGTFNVVASTYTGSDGRWASPMHLDADSYKLVISKPGVIQDKVVSLVVT